MTHEEIDILWQQAMRDSIKDGEMFTRYHFAKLVAEKALAQPHETTLKEFNQFIYDDPNYHIWAKKREAKVEGSLHVVCQCDKCKAPPPQRIEQEPVNFEKLAALGWQAMECNICGGGAMGYPQPEQERNFCSRCGKRTNDIYTCTPPKENT